jgi:hypothetical protein
MPDEIRAAAPTKPGKTKAAAAAKAELPSIPKELIDQRVTGPMSAQAVNAASMAFKKALIDAHWARSVPPAPVATAAR